MPTRSRSRIVLLSDGGDSEQKLHAKLHAARFAGRIDRAGAGLADIRSRIRKSGRVRGIKGLGAKLQPEANQRSIDRSEPGRLPSRIRLGQSAPPALVMPPAVVTANGSPPMKLRIPLTCQPPSTRSVSRLALPNHCFSLPKGSSYVELKKESEALGKTFFHLHDHSGANSR